MNRAQLQALASLRKTTFILLASTVLLASCRNPSRDIAANNGQECVYERVVGSNLPVQRCYDAGQREAEREGAEQGLDSLQDLQEYEGLAPGGGTE